MVMVLLLSLTGSDFDFIVVAVLFFYLISHFFWGQFLSFIFIYAALNLAFGCFYCGVRARNVLKLC